MARTLAFIVAAVLAAIAGALLGLGGLKALEYMFGPTFGWWALGLGLVGVLAWCRFWS